MSESTTNPASPELGVLRTYQAGALQASAHRKLKQVMTLFLRPYGLTMMEWLAVGFISDHGQAGTRLTELSNNLGTTMPYTTNLANQLQLKGWIERIDHARDNRAKLVRLAAGYEDTCREIEEYLRDKLRAHLYQRITRRQLQTYMHVIHQLSR